MRAVVVMAPTKEGPGRTYAGYTCSMSVNEALEFDLPVRDGPAGPDDGDTIYCDFSMLPDELGQRAARALVSIAAALRGDDSEFPWSEPDPVGVGIALQVLNCLPERKTISEGPVYRIAFREVEQDPGEADGDAPAQDRAVPAARSPKEKGTTGETDYLNTLQAARFVGLSTKTLARYWMKGKGPVFLRLGGRVRYLREALDAWARSRRRASTRDDGTVLTGAGQAKSTPPATDRYPGPARRSSRMPPCWR